MRVPRILTASFHRHVVVPALLRSMRAEPSGARSAFEGHVPLELPLLFVVSIAAAVGGTAAWYGHRSIVGLISGLAGMVGGFALLARSVGTPRNRSDLWAGFMTAAFAACVVSGMSVGLLVGAIVWKSTLAKCAFAAVGLAAGYVTGIGAGLGMQWLGWVGRFLVAFAIPLIIGLLALDIVLAIV